MNPIFPALTDPRIVRHTFPDTPDGWKALAEWMRANVGEKVEWRVSRLGVVEIWPAPKEQRTPLLVEKGTQLL